MKITEKGFYRTRGGDVAFVFRIDGSFGEMYPVKGCIINEGNERWTTQGKYFTDSEDDNDLVELIKPYSKEMLK